MARSNIFFRLMCAALIAAAAVSVSSCGSTKSISGDKGYTRTTSHDSSKKSASTHRAKPSKPVPAHLSTEGLDAATAAVLAEADSWQGTPYAWGGNTREGVDCSGFVTQVYKRAVGISLPRTSRTQQEHCSDVKKKDMVPGDLVFFATSDKHSGVSHVGIYVGANRMIHSSSSRGVIITDITSDYWTSHFHSAGRIDKFYAMASGSKKSAPKRKKEKTAPASVAPAQNPAPEMMAQNKPATPKRRASKPAQPTIVMTVDEFAQAQPSAVVPAQQEAPSAPAPDNIKSAPAEVTTPPQSAPEAEPALASAEPVRAIRQQPAKRHSLRQGEPKEPKAATSTADFRAKVLAGLDD